MKKYLLVAAALVAFAVKPARADDSLLKQAWDDFKSSATAHILDNAQPGYFYDFKHHVQMAGATTQLYTYRYASLDAGFVKSIQSNVGTGLPSHAIPIANLDLHVGSYINAKVPAVATAINKLGLNTGVLQYVVVGAWAGKDLTTKEYLYGVSGGVRVTFR
jgi:hypothetical protein